MKPDGNNPWLIRRLRDGKTLYDKVTLETQDLIMRPLRLRDAKDFHHYAKDPEVARYVLWDPHANLAQTRAVLLGLIAQSRQEQLFTRALVLKDSGRMIGTIGLVWRDWESHAAEVGFSMAKDCWGRGLMTQALTQYLCFVFTRLGIHRVEARHDALNPASGAVMQKAGLCMEGVLKERLFYKNRYASVVLYAAIARDWLKEHS
ncbi:MAG: GNAT family N-acetyltransferase [Christensenellales bacterium]|jgi:ribosomal-protein-alanine N-acetyltransferase